MKESYKIRIPFIIEAIFSIILANLGAKFIKDFPEKPYLGIMTILLAFLIIYLSSYTNQIKNNLDKIKELEEELKKIRERIEIDEKLLNSLTHIKLIERK